MQIEDRLGIQGACGSVSIISVGDLRYTEPFWVVLLFLARHRSSKHALVTNMVPDGQISKVRFADRGIDFEWRNDVICCRYSDINYTSPSLS
jgi:hypothetical protein